MELVELIARLLLAMVLGGVIGLERELRERAAGFRTHILVCVGSAAFTIASAYGFEAWMTTADESVVRMDPGRIAAQIVSGIGFLGAGAIIRHGISVRGLTTAAGLWAVAAVGLAAGIGMYALAIATTLTVVLSLSGLHIIENRIIAPRLRERIQVLVVFRRPRFGRLGALVAKLEERHVRVLKISIEPDDREENSVRLHLRLPLGLSSAELVEEITRLPDVDGVAIE
jgi:putative Mg2+ transporter-C (MgtC) family protein